MRTQARLAMWIAVMALLALGLTGCFRSVGDDLDPTLQSDVVPQAPQPGGTATTQSDDITPDATADDLAPTEEQLTPPPSPVQSTDDSAPSLTPFPTFGVMTLTPLPTSVDGQGGPLVSSPTATSVLANSPVPPQATYTRQPTSTPLPTQGSQATYTPLPTYTPFPTNTSYPTNTPLPTYTRQPSATPQPPAIGPTRTFTPVPFSIFPPSPTYTPYAGSALSGVQSIAMLPAATATPPVVVNTSVAAQDEAVPLGERPPAAAQATPFGATDALPTATPTLADVPQGGGTPPLDQGDVAEVALQATLSPGQQTATLIVYEATATTAALTGTPIATWTPAAASGQVDPLATQPAVQQQQAIPAGQFPPNATVITATPFGQGGICDEHLISLGDTLSSIARLYGVTAEQIQQANPATIPTVDDITAGTTINIPCPVPITPTPQPVPVVTGAPDGQGGVLTTDRTTTTTTTTTQQQVHVVVPGDTLFSISRQYGVDINNLLAANGYNTRTMNFIVEGEEILIPGQTIAVTAVPANTTGATTTTGVQPTATPYIVIVTPAGQ